MGPTLARMAVRCLAESDSRHRVYAVARFSQSDVRTRLEEWGVHTIACDLLDRESLRALPDATGVVFMAGQKFGTAENASLTWALNTYVPALVAERYPASRIVVLSTGNVYPYTQIVHGGACENTPVAPVGEYAASCVGRERMFEHFSRTRNLRCAIMRLNYANELRYGVLVDIARRVLKGKPVELGAGAFNAIWQGDANGQAIGLLHYCAAPAFVLNVTGPETVSVRWVAECFGALFGCNPLFVGDEPSTALLSNSANAQQLFGYPTVSIRQMIEWIAHWLLADGQTLEKPTHFETRDGRY